ncbi:MAG: serine/threonine-protein kinase [Actinobacteria bacterium]|nr:serine/threonine-protein kinase [Actinomycetota bacterium]
MKKMLGERYELGAMIGTGGMADVYLAQDVRLNRQVAIKILRSDLARDPSFVTRFNKEALSVAALNHPGIVSVYDSGKEDSPSGAMPYIVMEYVEGKTLREIVNKGERFALNRAVEITEGILIALQYSHKNGIIHRDIKPGNIMITDNGDVKVMDFGIARALADTGATMTSTWNIIGTAQYLSPEQATGTQADARSDLYSVGCLLYELLAGRPPFTGDTPVAIAYQHVSAPLVPITELQESLDPALNAFFSIALAKDANERYQSANAMLKDLRKLIKGEGITTQIPKEVRAALTAAGLRVSRTIAVDSEQEPGIVLKIIPEPGSTVEAGTGVVLEIASGNISVPSLVGLNEIEARTILTQAGFLVKIVEAYDANQVIGIVLAQAPTAGEVKLIGSSVTITINKTQG